MLLNCGEVHNFDAEFESNQLLIHWINTRFCRGPPGGMLAHQNWAEDLGTSRLIWGGEKA